MEDAAEKVIANYIAEKRVWLPGMNKPEAVSIPMTAVEAIGKIEPYHADMNGFTATGGIRGPFDIEEIKGKSVPTYPVIWSHDAENQRNLAFDGESEGIPRKAATKKDQEIVDQKVASVWASASYRHFNRDFRFNSQSNEYAVHAAAHDWRAGVDID